MDMQEKVRRAASAAITATHNYYKGLEQRDKGFHFETFGEWKKVNPNHKIANKLFPDDEYILIINQWFKYFDQVYNEDIVILDIETAF